MQTQFIQACVRPGVSWNSTKTTKNNNNNMINSICSLPDTGHEILSIMLLFHSSYYLAWSTAITEFMIFF